MKLIQLSENKYALRVGFNILGWKYLSLNQLRCLDVENNYDPVTDKYVFDRTDVTVWHSYIGFSWCVGTSDEVNAAIDVYQRFIPKSPAPTTRKSVA